MRQITGGDAFFLFSDTANVHQQISLLFIYDQSALKQPLGFKFILKQIEERLSASPIFHQKLAYVPFTLDYPYWVDDPDFDLEFHVRHIALPAPADWRQLCIQFSRLHASPIDLSRSPWEMYVIEGLDNIDFLPKKSFAILLKVHHVAIDGVTAAKLTFDLHDTEPSPSQARRIPQQAPSAPPRMSQILVRTLVNNTRASYRTAQQLASMLTRKARDQFSAAKTEPRQQEPVPLTRFNQAVSPHRVWDAVTFELSDILSIKQSVPGATVNDVVQTICGGAMTRYLKSKNEAPESSLTAMVPVSVRTAEEASGDPGNKVVMAKASLCTQESDPLKRLALVSEEMRYIKVNAGSARDMIELEEALPALSMLMLMKSATAALGPGKSYRLQHNMLITNVPGPRQPLYFSGAKLVMLSGMAVCLDQIAINHAATSYNGKLVIAPLADRAVMQDPENYSECLLSAFKELKSAAEKATEGKGKTRRASR